MYTLHCQVSSVALRSKPLVDLRKRDRFLVDFDDDHLWMAKELHPHLWSRTEFEVCSVGILKYGKAKTTVRFAVLRSRAVHTKPFSEPFLMDAYPLVISQVRCHACCYNVWIHCYCYSV